MKLLVIGLGSMGKRRIRLLKKYFIQEGTENWKICGVDNLEIRCKEVKETYGIDTFSSLEEAMESDVFDGAVISTSPLSHGKIIKQCLENKLHVFTEINLVSDFYNENINLAKKNEKVLFLSSTFMYRKEIRYIKSQLERERTGIYNYHIGQYLPEWHPWESYKKFFVNDERTNGCREIFAIELPWLIDIFGKPISVYSTHNKMSTLELNYDDAYCVVIEHETGIIGNLLVDIVTPNTERQFKFWNEKKYIEWGGTPDSLKVLDTDIKEIISVDLYDCIEQQQEYNSFIIENAYFDELVNFINVITRKEKQKYFFEQDIAILRWIDEIEK